MVRVLVIEDEATLLEDMVELLKLEGYDARAAEDGVIGIEIAYSWTPDIIICDLMMPRMNGFEVLTQLRADAATALTPFIILTALGDQELRHQARLAGADDFVTKPFTTHELVETIQARLYRHAMINAGAEHRLELARTQLVRMVTHELRTPLISINTVVEVLSRQLGQLTPAETQELLDTIMVGSRRLTHRVEQLVFITQLDAGVLTRESMILEGLEMRMWELLVAANNLARRFAYQMQPGVTVNLQERDREASVICNPYALKQALAELIANALTFTPANTEVNITLWRRDETILISVTDKGMGIPQDKLSLALEAFQQIDRDKREQQGMGIGLWLAQRLIVVHGGTLDIRSVDGKGTQVIIRLPVTGTAIGD